MIYTIIGLFVLLLAQILLSFFERRGRDSLIDRLTDKVMSRDYRDYVWGQDMKKTLPEPVFKNRSDEAEARIEQANKKAEELSKTLPALAKRLEEKKREPTG